MYRNRLEAAERLAERLGLLAGQHPLVLVRKIGAPGNPEYAIGAVSEDGSVHLEEEARGGREAWLAGEVERQRELIAERRRRYTPVRSPIDPAGRLTLDTLPGHTTTAGRPSGRPAVTAWKVAAYLLPTAFRLSSTSF